MLRSERQAKILQLIKERGFIKNEDLCQFFRVTSVTIRRDLKDLSMQNLIKLDHGGAMDVHYLGATIEPLYQIKMNLNIEKKREIGRVASALVEEGDTIILDSGTTTLQIAQHLKNTRLRALTVITYDITIASELCPEPNINVIVTGGILRKSLYALYGPYTEANLKNIRARKTFLAIDGATIDQGILNSFLEEVPIKQSIIQQGTEVILVTDSSKFGRAVPFKVCSWNAIDRVITDNGVPSDYMDIFANNEIKTEIVNICDEF